MGSPRAEIRKPGDLPAHMIDPDGVRRRWRMALKPTPAELTRNMGDNNEATIAIRTSRLRNMPPPQRRPKRRTTSRTTSF